MSVATDPGRPQLHAPGLLLRPWRPEDAQRVFEACQDPLIQRWTGVPSPYLLEHAEGFVTTTTERAWSEGSAALFGVFDGQSGDLLGSNGLISLDRSRGEAEIGYWMAPWARRRGAATRATHALAAWCLDELGLRRLQWRAEVGNHASRLVAERVGFRIEGLLREGVWRRDGRRADGWIGSLLPGQLRGPDDPVDPLLRLRATTFAADQPRLAARTSRGEAIALRRPASRDLEAIMAACRDPETRRWTTVPDPYERADAVSFVEGHAHRRWARAEGATFAIVDAADTFAGSMELRADGAGRGDVGFLVAPWARGRGYGSAALRALCRWGFEALGLHRVEWRAYAGNEASRRVAERAGFTIEGVARGALVQRGIYRDAWTGSLLRGDTERMGS